MATQTYWRRAAEGMGNMPTSAVNISSADIIRKPHSTSSPGCKTNVTGRSPDVEGRASGAQRR